MLWNPFRRNRKPKEPEHMQMVWAMLMSVTIVVGLSATARFGFQITASLFGIVPPPVLETGVPMPDAMQADMPAEFREATIDAVNLLHQEVLRYEYLLQTSVGPLFVELVHEDSNWHIAKIERLHE